jgi:two-component system, chemotaxis family, CheB/CheR fusion protein
MPTTPPSATDATAPDGSSVAESARVSLPRVVAIGASAGGLEALEGFFAGLGACNDAAFVVIQHLSPDHKSMMEQLLSRHTPMPVMMVEDGMALQGGKVFLLPPAATMRIESGRLCLSPKRSKVLTLPIDLFFSSLARACGPAAIGVVLSGTGSDGSRGAVEINEAGGILFAQDTEQAKFDGMPRSVISTGVVDFVLPTEAMGAKLKEMLLSPLPVAEPAVSVDADQDEGGAIASILAMVHDAGGVDFRQYKPNSLMRRIDRRMRVHNLTSYAGYATLLKANREELQLLQREILIPVTSFFRDPDHFDALARLAVAPIVANTRDGDDIRVWVTACSTGEEAYSIAILFLEAFEHARRWPALKIFATDVDRQNIETASAGLYPESILSEVSPERLERYFMRRGNQYEVQKKVREKIIFARHNVLEDPPFTRIQLLTCRNMLIYVQSSAQVNILRRFQYSLAAGGYLFLGSSETLGDVAADFATLAGRQKIYQVLRRNELPLSFTSRLQPREERRERRSRLNAVAEDAPSEEQVIDTAHVALLQAYAPASVLISPGHEVVHMFGDARRYLQLPEGQISLDLAKLLPGPLSPIGVALMQKAARDRQAVRSHAIALQLIDGRHVDMSLTVRPLTGLPGTEPYMLLSFEGLPIEQAEAVREGLDVGQENQAHIRLLEQELAATRESLQATIEELETSNEELQATNEELMSSNEELQSSNEELQSVNEELYTVNAEHQEKIEILHRLNADLDHMARAVSIATVFVDSAIRITRFTPEARRFFRVQDSDIGRPLEHFSYTLSYPDFIPDVDRTMLSGEMSEREVRASDGNNYLVRVLPYTVREGEPRGAVISVIDTTSLHTSKRLQAVMNSLPEHIAEINAEGQIVLVNRAWAKFAQDNGDNTMSVTGVGTNYLDICRRSSDSYSQRAFLGLTRVLHRDENFFSMQYPCHSPTEKRWFLMYAAPIDQAGGGAIVSHVNITEWMLERE